MKVDFEEDCLKSQAAILRPCRYRNVQVLAKFEDTIRQDLKELVYGS
jgi:hypothetical protein